MKYIMAGIIAVILIMLYCFFRAAGEADEKDEEMRDKHDHDMR